MQQLSKTGAEAREPISRNRGLSVVVCATAPGARGPVIADEDGALSVRLKHQDAVDALINEAGGRVVKAANGRLLLEFPDAFTAVHVSLAIQRMMAARNRDVPPDQRFSFRMGMHVGELVVDAKDVSGSGIVIAERLREIADPGGICLSRAAHAAVHEDFDSLFPDGGSKELKDLDAPVHVYNLAPEVALLGVPVVTAPRRLLSLIVLPFANVTGDPRHDFLADSVTDQLTSELARIEDSLVADGKMVLAAAAFGADFAALGQRLGIRYVINGAVSRESGGLRIIASLIDTHASATIWNDHLSLTAGDPFVMQHDANARLVPLIYARLLAVTGQKPLHALLPEIRPATAPTRTLVIAPKVIGEAVPATVTQATRSKTIEPRSAAEASSAPNVADAVDPMAALLARWPVLHRPRRRLVELARPLKQAPVRVIAPQPEARAGIVIHPRTEVKPGYPAGRVVVLRAATESQTAQPVPSPYATNIGAMPIPPSSDRPEWRMPLLLHLIFLITASVFGGAIAVATQGVESLTVVAIASWILISLGLAQLCCATVESIRSRRLLRPVGAEQVVGGRLLHGLPAGAVSIRAVPRSPRGISRSSRSAPLRWSG